MPTGWECPRCHKVWAPHVAQCSCPTPAVVPLSPFYPYIQPGGGTSSPRFPGSQTICGDIATAYA